MELNTPQTPDEALERLLAGNRRFIGQEIVHPIVGLIGFKSWQSTNNCESEPLLKPLILQESLKVVGRCYNLDTGEVTLFTEEI
jgi:hypothetical protein